MKDQVALDELPKDLRNVADRFSRGEISSKQVYCNLGSQGPEPAGSLRHVANSCALGLISSRQVI